MVEEWILGRYIVLYGMVKSVLNRVRERYPDAIIKHIIGFPACSDDIDDYILVVLEIPLNGD